MATLTEKKLDYLQGTKDAIKNALIEKGQAVSSTDTFRSYADKIREITGGGGGIPTGYHSVTFMNGDNVLFERLVLSGDDCPDPLTQGRIETPTKESTVQYNYTYSGWTSVDGGTADSNVLKNITEDKVVYSAYTKTGVKYTITYYDEDGETVLHTEQLSYGTIPSYVPTREGTLFGEWLPTPVMVTGNASYTAMWSSILVNGACGASGYSVNWALYDNYVLVISGTGNMANYQYSSSVNNRPWADYQEQIKGIVVENGVTRIGTYAFAKCNCISAIIADSVTYIDYNAFYQCAKLESIIIPDSVTTMGNAVFAGCTNLASVTFGGNVPIKQSAFSNTALTDITIPRTASIGNYAFENCKNLENVIMPINVKTINTQAFYGCSTLTNVYYEGSETDKANITINTGNTPLTNATWHYNYTY